MLDRIATHVMDLLQNDRGGTVGKNRLFQGGNAYAPGWSGVRRPDNGRDVATGGFVNLFDDTMEPSGGGHRPAVYLGMKALEATDDLDFPTCSGPPATRVEYRKILLPLVIVTQAQGALAKAAARHQRNQLRSNILNILHDHLIESGYWYEATFPGAKGGGGNAMERAWVSASGQGDQSAAVAIATLPMVIRYSRGANAPA
jgi:hypothetical protein